MIKIQHNLQLPGLSSKIKKLWELSGEKIVSIEKRFDGAKGSPVVTRDGKYSTQGWTEWTQGFQYGSALFQFDATGERAFLETARKNVVGVMAPHLSHTGVHDHGFNNVSTYGNLLRLMTEGKIQDNEWEKNFFELAIKISGAVQAGRWTPIQDGGFIHSFNGAHSLFVDTIRSIRALVLSHQLGHILQGEGDLRISLLERALHHLKATAKFSVYYGEGRDVYDVPGRTAHESIFNVKDGQYRCPGSQQGFSPFSTWTRGLAWAMCGFAEQLEFFDSLTEGESTAIDKKNLMAVLLRAAKATCDFYIATTPSDGIPYWDTGAPGLHKLGTYIEKPADPFNDFEPVDSSAAAIASQGLLRLGNYLKGMNELADGEKYWQAGLTVLNTILEEPYLNTDPAHEGLILHSVYHRPNGWDYVPKGSKIPNGESCMWGDYHAREVCLYAQRVIGNEPYYTFFNVN